MSPTHEAALRYAARGWPVLPLAWPVATGDDARCSCADRACKRIGKHPHATLVRHGLADASTDPRRVGQWWRAAPLANIGVVLGEPAGLWALDVDPVHQGDRTLVDLVRDQGPLGDTLHAITGSGGDHFFFTWPGETVRNVPCAPGLDVRGDAGYVVAAPSMHASGARYAWASSGPALPAPAWLLARVCPPAVMRPDIVIPPFAAGRGRRPDAKTRAISYLSRLPPAIQGQRGSDACFRAALHLVRGFGLDERDAVALLVDFYNPACVPPWSLRELEHKVRSAARSSVPVGYLLEAEGA